MFSRLSLHPPAASVELVAFGRQRQNSRCSSSAVIDCQVTHERLTRLKPPQAPHEDPATLASYSHAETQLAAAFTP